MRTFRMRAVAGLIGLVLGTTAAYAAVDAEQAKRLGNDLTPAGGEKAGNGGAIPAWEGGLTRPPAGYKVGTFHLDPFADDKASLQITPANYKEHAEKLSAGAQAMFVKYPTFRMDVYPTRRSASFPQRSWG